VGHGTVGARDGGGTVTRNPEPGAVRHSTWQLCAAVVTAAMLGLMTLWSAIVTLRHRANANCLTPDNKAYCDLARGAHAVAEPFNRRPLLPFIVRLLPVDNVTTGFRAVNMLSLLMAAAAVAILTMRVTRGRTSPVMCALAGVISGCLVILMPHGLRLAWIFSDLTDVAALALGAIWVVTLTGRRSWLAWPWALAAITCREQWVAAVVCVAAWFLWTKRTSLGVSHLAAALAGAIIVLSRPHTAVSYTTNPRASFGVMQRAGLSGMTWVLLVFGALFVALLIAVRPRRRLTELEVILLIVAVAQLLLGVVGGSDMSRLIAPSLPFFVCLAVGWSMSAGGSLGLASVSAAYVLLWHPWQVTAPTGLGYRLLTRPYADPGWLDRFRHDMAVALPVLGLLVVVGVVKAGAGRAGPADNGSVEGRAQESVDLAMPEPVETGAPAR
jgi:hypothetical protein